MNSLETLLGSPGRKQKIPVNPDKPSYDRPRKVSVLLRLQRPNRILFL